MEKENKTLEELAGKPEKPEGKNQEVKEGEGQANKVIKPQETIDYKAELERLEQEKEANKVELEKARKKIRHLESSNADADDDDIDDRIKQVVSQEVAGIRKEMTKPQAEIIASQLASNDNEQKLIMWYYDNRITPSGNLREDLENAKLLVNKKRILAENSELQRALFSKENRGTDTGSGQKIPTKPDEPTLSKEEQVILGRLKEQGYKWDGQKYVNPKRKDLFWKPGS